MLRKCVFLQYILLYSFIIAEDKLEYKSKTYTRIKLFENDLFEIVLICMNGFQSSKIHDHAENGCLMKVLKGNYVENIYYPKTKNKICSKIRYTNQITYINNKIAYHKLLNPFAEKAVSLHIYSPPNHKTEYYN